MFKGKRCITSEKQTNSLKLSTAVQYTGRTLSEEVASEVGSAQKIRVSYGTFQRRSSDYSG